MNWAIACFKFFASLRLAILLLVALGIAFGVGTFIESYHGAPAAQALIYYTPWLRLLLVLLALNLLASALDRIPWKKKHIGFLTTHLGIILILFGALITQAFGIEGQLQIREGETEGRMMLSRSLIEVLSIDSGQRWNFSLGRHVFPWKGRDELVSTPPSPLKVHLLTQYPKAKLLETVRESKTGAPVLHVALKGSMAASDHWLFLEDPSRNSANLGPAVVRFSNEPLRIQKQEPPPEMGTLQFHFEDGSSNEIRLDQKSVDKIFPLAGKPYRVHVKRIFKDAVVQENQLVDHSEEWRNPAVQLLLQGEGLSEPHTVFAKFPEFPTLHGLAPSEAHVRIAYEHSDFSDATAKNELRLIHQSNGFPRYQVKRGNDLKEGEVELGKEIETGWMDFKFAVDSYFEHAAIEKAYSPLPNLSESGEAMPVIKVEFEKAGERKSLWLPQGEMGHLALGGSDYHVVHGLHTRPLGFQVELRDFVIDTDPGTDRPASFKSLVKLKDASRGINREQVIQMNEPLKHRGFKVYQSAYHVTPGEPDISIFTVARDPGNPLKYAGAIIMVGGILMLFYVKPFSTLKSSDPKLRSK